MFKDAIIKLKEYVEKYQDEEFLEIEVRIGYYENKFKADIGKVFFDKINENLADSEVWKKIDFEKSVDYFFDGKRLSMPKNICIEKIKLAVLDFHVEGSGFDLRVSFCKEMPVEKFDLESADHTRKKERTSYLWKHISFDITEVITINNSIQTSSYEIELESVYPGSKIMTSHYFVHDLLLKVKDIIEMCEPLENPKIVFFN